MVVSLALQPPQDKNKASFQAADDPLQSWSDEELRKRFRFGRGLNFLTGSSEANKKSC